MKKYLLRRCWLLLMAIVAVEAAQAAPTLVVEGLNDLQVGKRSYCKATTTNDGANIPIHTELKVTGVSPNDIVLEYYAGGPGASGQWAVIPLDAQGEFTYHFAGYVLTNDYMELRITPLPGAASQTLNFSLTIKEDGTNTTLATASGSSGAIAAATMTISSLNRLWVDTTSTFRVDVVNGGVNNTIPIYAEIQVEEVNPSNIVLEYYAGGHTGGQWQVIPLDAQNPFTYDFTGYMLSTDYMELRVTPAAGSRGDTLRYSVTLKADTTHVTVAQLKGKVAIKAIPTVTFPTATAAITYGDALSTVTLSSDEVGDGSFAWEKSDTIPKVTNSGYAMLFTPNDTVSYDYTGMVGWDESTSTLRQVVSVTVNPRQLTVADPTLDTVKVYDGTDTVAGTPNVGAITNLVGSDDVAVAIATATYNNKNVGVGKAITVTYSATLTGAESGNYAKPDNFLCTGKITKLQLTVDAPTLTLSKVYDGTDTVAGTPTAGGITNSITGDDVSVAIATATYDDKNVGDNKTITVAYADPTGAEAGNYSKPADYSTSTGEITKRPLTVNDPTLTLSKIYDGTDTVAGTPTAGGITNSITGDDVSVAI
ncbi:MAG: YDG domain-containing protein, partial [Prevotellaceae bacterium]|nr:YDG domain-containing protein [Prevotellaceae bacterium]